MTPRWLSKHHRQIVATAMFLWAGSLAGFVALVVAYDLDFFGPVGGPWVLAYSAFAITGALITWQRPEHTMGPLFLAVGSTITLANGMSAATLGPLADHPITVRALFAAVGVAVGTASFPLLPIAIVTFPDGRLPSARWRWIWGVAALTATLGAVAAFLVGAFNGDEREAIVGPPFEGTPEALGRALSPIYLGLTAGLLVASALAIVLRYRRSAGTIRRQIRWLVLAVLLATVASGVVVLMELLLAVPPSAVAPALVNLTVAGAIALVPLSVTIAILRHRLFDIDVALNRTIVFGSLAVFITAVYVAIVVGLGSLLGDPSNLILTVGATALVAVVFEPVRARVQHWANVAVYGRRATPYEILSRITDDLGAATSHEDQLGSMATLLADGTSAEHATVWMAFGDRLEAVACWPDHDVGDHPAVEVNRLAERPSGATSHLEPVRQDGELIGAMSLERRRDDPVTSREQRLVAELAGQASLVLDNARLRAALRARLEELRTSRARLVAAQDEARRRLERDLHDGAQQQLVALKVKLGMARTIASKEAADEHVIRGVEELSRIADDAIDHLRALARGIYPPLLEAEGLERAVRAQVGAAPIEVIVRTHGIGRYPRQVESTVYFCLVEGLGNTVRHAGATYLDIYLEDHGDELTFALRDDGCGFSPDEATGGLGLRNMADRLDALGGSLTVDAAPGVGVRLRGTIPLANPVDRQGVAPTMLQAT